MHFNFSNDLGGMQPNPLVGRRGLWPQFVSEQPLTESWLKAWECGLLSRIAEAGNQTFVWCHLSLEVTATILVCRILWYQNHRDHKQSKNYVVILTSGRKQTAKGWAFSHQKRPWIDSHNWLLCRDELIKNIDIS